MNLKEYINLLTDFADKNPHTLNLEVIDSNFNGIYCDTLEEGYLKRNHSTFNSFTTKERFDDLNIKENVNAICIS